MATGVSFPLSKSCWHEAIVSYTDSSNQRASSWEIIVSICSLIVAFLWQSLYTYPDNFRAYKILVAAEYSGAKIALPPFKFGETNQTAEFLKKFPLGKVC